MSALRLLAGLLLLSSAAPYALFSSTFADLTASARSALTPSGRRGKGKLSVGLELNPPTPTSATEVILLSGSMAESSRALRVDGKCKWLVVPAKAVVENDEGWEVDIRPFLEEQVENAPPGSIPERTLVFVNLEDCGGDFWGEKAEELKDAGLTGVVASNEADVVKAVEAGVAVVYAVKATEPGDSLDFTPHLSSLPDVSGMPASDYLSGVVIEPSPRFEFGAEDRVEDDDASDDANYELLPLPPKPFDKVPVVMSTATIAGSGRLGKSCRLISKAGYPSCLLKHDISPPSQRVELSKLSAFWTLALQSLGRKTSSQFGGFRSKIAVGLKDDVPMQWYKYQKQIMEDGALGTKETADNDPLNTAGGDYKGF
mmetsp:Transcript_18124/g.36936  ORF Transcript_18124/g.36936 Transcript_18124/m.36936 type:complete len:371 (-) Transcript_18124:90-1202(-)|eukprot:CAMPEP_0197545160 /NCGR_PEP_ID=MMETSP1320-20131121/319_1 /TAXON_ID=91990 /ORGANISM="Bolidomonas sp., Strain RCC2347" /LENGTH=370 /DNA_ID=CAMNT_0043104647 /DNA_START=177 /DNA_END=1289 /DNA_ORIENTATION=+